MYLLFLGMFVSPYECMCTVFMLELTDGGQKWVSDLLEMELQVFESCHMSARNRTWFLCKNSKCSFLHPHLLIY